MTNKRLVIAIHGVLFVAGYAYSVLMLIGIGVYSFYVSVGNSTQVRMLIAQGLVDCDVLLGAILHLACDNAGLLGGAVALQ